jgi:putative intracellular protease/amidase
MQIAIPIYDGFTALDAVGPYEVLSRLPGARVVFVAAERGPKRTDTGALAIVADESLADTPEPAIVCVPGGPGTRALLGDNALVDWLRAVHPRTQWTTSVCTGSLLLGAAGVLTGLPATTHWAAMEILASLGATPVAERVVIAGKVVTAAGVSAGIDMALTLAARIAGDDVAQAIQLGIEYDPQPPFDSGAPGRAPAPVLELVRGLMSERSERIMSTVPRSAGQPPQAGAR